MRINEILNTNMEFSVKRESPYEYVVQARIGEHVIEVELNQDGDGEPWTLEFFANNSLNLTGAGNEFKVFSLVKQAVDHVIARHDPYRIVFSAKADEGRHRLYRKLASKIPGYKLKENNEGQYVQFELIRSYD